MLVSDGIVEVENADGLEFGLEKIERMIKENSQQPLKEITEKIMTEVGRFGPRTDDQTVLLMRILS